MTVSSWREAMAAMVTEWSAIPAAAPPPDTGHWQATFESLHAAYVRLVAQGRWRSGPRDLMSVLGEVDLELSHSRVVAWLLTPTAHHGLGRGLLHRILSTGWPESQLPHPESADVSLEVTQRDEAGATRADVIVRMGSTILVLENKVWASESEGQCEALYRHWRDEAEDVRFLLLSREGHLPLTTTSEEAQQAWRAMSFRHLACLVEEVAADSDDLGAALSAVDQYLVALRSLVGAPVPFTIERRE